MITVEEIKSWQKDPVTVAFMDRIKLHRMDSDKHVHLSLENQALDEAVKFNAKFVSFGDALEIPQEMIDDAKEGEDDSQ